jgi:hypothetical protein
MTTKQEDLINDLADAYHRLVWEQIGSASYVMALKSNGKEVTEERTKWHTIMLNRELNNMYNVLRSLGVRGKTPVVKFGAGRRCDIRCTSAKGHECTCQCGGLNHGLDNYTLRRTG